MFDGLIGRYRPEMPLPDIEVTSDEEKRANEAESDQLRRELAHLQVRALRLATEGRQGDRTE